MCPRSREKTVFHELETFKLRIEEKWEKLNFISKSDRFINNLVRYQKVNKSSLGYTKTWWFCLPTTTAIGLIEIPELFAI